jgi:hypothetical protein
MAVPVSIDGKSILTLYSIHSKKYTKVSKISISIIPIFCRFNHVLVSGVSFPVDEI